MKKTAVLVVILAALISAIFWKIWPSIINGNKVQNENITLNIWGLEEEAIFKPILTAYQISRPDVKIIYTKQSLLNYRSRVQTQIGAGQGPDIFIIHSSWRPVFMDYILASPVNIMPVSEFTQIYYPFAKDALFANDKIYGIPENLDGLAMFYNVDILKAAGVKLPKTWADFMEAAKTVTVKDAAGQIQTAGAGIGTAENVDFWPEILALLFLQQPGADLVSPASKTGSEVLQFYTGFVIDPQKKVWDTTLPSSSQMFASGRLAFYFAPVSQVSYLKENAPNVNFGVSIVPQLTNKVISYGGFWAWAVSSSSKNGTASWEFLKFLSIQNLPIPNYISPRVDQAGQYLKDPILGAFVLQAPYYKGWYLNSNTGDKGINDEMIKNYGDAINGVLQGRDALQMLQITQTGVKETLKNIK